MTAKHRLGSDRVMGWVDMISPNRQVNRFARCEEASRL